MPPDTSTGGPLPGHRGRALARFPWFLVGAHWLICITFLVAREPEPRGQWLDELEAARRPGAILLNTAAPRMYLAERPLYGWNEWHGGEETWVKAIEVANLVPLALAECGDTFLDMVGVLPVRARSWLVASWFFALSTGQWLVVGIVLKRMAGRKVRTPLEGDQRPS